MNRILIFAGAGISAESGLSTFRDSGGLWTKYNIDEVCNYLNFTKYKEDQEKRSNLFKFYNDVKKSILVAQPNSAHLQIADWQKNLGEDRVVVVTANIDDLFERAGCKNVIHVHGEIFNMHCAACGHEWYVGEKEYEDVRCPTCHSRLTKPNIIFFYEDAPKYEQMYYHFHPKRRSQDDLLLYIGSSQSVIPPSLLFKSSNEHGSGVKVLINKDKGIEDYLFNYKYYGLATEQIKRVHEDFVLKYLL